MRVARPSLAKPWANENLKETLINPNLRRSREGGLRRQDAGANIGIAVDPTGEPQERRVNPVTFSQLVEKQWHWMTHASRRSPSGPPAAFRFGIHAFAGPDIASRFRDDEQNQSFLNGEPGLALRRECKRAHRGMALFQIKQEFLGRKSAAEAGQ